MIVNTNPPSSRPLPVIFLLIDVALLGDDTAVDKEVVYPCELTEYWVRSMEVPEAVADRLIDTTPDTPLGMMFKEMVPTFGDQFTDCPGQSLWLEWQIENG